MASESQIQKELNSLGGEQGLFLDKEYDSRYGNVLYSVKHVVDGSLYTALEWRDPSGRPLGLNESLYGADLVATLRSQEGSIQEALRTALVNNAALKELKRQEAHKQATEVAEDWDAHKRGSKFISTGTGGMDHKTALNKRDI